MKSQPGMKHLEGAPLTQSQIEARREIERKALIPAANRPEEPKHPPHLRPDGTPKDMCWIHKGKPYAQLAYIAEVQRYIAGLEAGDIVGPFPGRAAGDQSGPAPPPLYNQSPDPIGPPPADLRLLPADQYAKAVKSIQAEERAAARAVAPPPRDSFNQAKEQGISDDVRQRIAEKAAQYEREMAEERQRNHERGRDMGRAR